MTAVAPEDVRRRDPRAVRDRLIEIAREFEDSGRLEHAVDEGVRAHLPSAGPDRPERWGPLAAWASQTLGVHLAAAELAEACAPAGAGEEGGDGDGLPPPAPDRAARDLLLARARSERRARMTELERYILLQVHDTSWKDHLLAMDHLKSGVGLRGYAQKDPLIEFKREGLESFEKMLESAREKFSDLFFKARWVRQDALARIWAGQSSEHAVAASVYEAQRRAAMQATQQAQMAQEGEAVKTIVRAGPKVGSTIPAPAAAARNTRSAAANE